ncbi:A/G-specific adenine glycosylase [Nonlabens spongiae]|uniref:Adenine DNA glycosylase n=1 Tax=Nonlabens spongiae TaxID=331648 RepID=A0A1W6MLJ4_9FLAO|nr:A/G-specific adenine glycosylase [Nonlabens spongiae]ARN78468.1 A/G-specific adenine glycosylase [Nonlabens spongiae]
MEISARLLEWYKNHHRSLPWRKTRDPYKIWLSEIILQQTRVNQGLPYYLNFIETFPTVDDLARAPQEQVLKLWQGLGYYSRARNLHKAAQQVVEDGGIFPTSYKDLLTLKGVGAYTAAAIASFCYDEVVPVVDGNVYRVLSRLMGISSPINTTPGQKEFRALATMLISKKDPATYNQAIMEFGATHCTPKNPLCNSCPFQTDCVAFNMGKVDELPVKVKKTKVKNLFHHYLVVLTPQNKTILQQRPQSGIWAGLYEFPFVESIGNLLFHELREDQVFQELLGGVRFRESVYNQDPIVHKLSHRKVHAYFWVIETETEIPNAITRDEAAEKPVHVLIERFMREFWNITKE